MFYLISMDASFFFFTQVLRKITFLLILLQKAVDSGAQPMSFLVIVFDYALKQM